MEIYCLSIPRRSLCTLSLFIDLLLESEAPLPIWQVRNQHYWNWDYGQIKITTEKKFSLLITATRGDNDGKVPKSPERQPESFPSNFGKNFF